MKYSLRALLGIALSAALVVGAPGGAFAAAPSPQPGSAAQCTQKITSWPDYECGFVTVPQSYADPSAGTVKLAYIRLESASPRAGPPIIKLVGPDSDGLAQVNHLARSLKPFLADRDYVFVAQRGTQGADPELSCNGLVSANNQAWLADLPQPSRQQARDHALTACITNFTSKGINLANYNADTAAADIDTLRQALGYRKIDIAGESYGTVAAQFMMRLYPQTIDAVVLDGVVPVAKTDVTAGAGASAAKTFNDVFADCARVASCNAAFPQSQSQLVHAYQKLQAKPALVSVAVGGRTVPATVNGDLMVNSLFTSLQTTEGSAALPLNIQHIDHGQNSVLGPLVAAYLDENGANVARYPAVCSDDPPQTPTDLAGLPVPYAAIESVEAQNYIHGCAVLGVPRLKSDSDQPITSPIPSLLVNGGLDPVSPPAQAAQVAAGLSHHVQITVPAGAHIQSTDPCVISIEAAFLRSTSTKPDTSCLSDAPIHPAFVTH